VADGLALVATDLSVEEVDGVGVMVEPARGRAGRRAGPL
jgi:hypothetical protein